MGRKNFAERLREQLEEDFRRFGEEAEGWKLIVVHPGGGGHICFDIFCPPGEEPEELEGFGYRADDCPYVREAGRSDYVCSEDLSHASIFNWDIVEVVNSLVEKGFKVRFMYRGEEY